MLELKENYLKELPLTIDMISMLEKLLIDSNQIKELPRSFTFPRLHTFTAARNVLESLPDAIVNCKELEVLDVTGNPLMSKSNFGLLATELPKLREFAWK